MIIDSDRMCFYNLPTIEYYKKYKYFLANTMYYLGKQNLCMIISNSRIPNLTEEFFGQFAPYILKIEKDMQSKELFTLKNLEKDLWDKFLSHFYTKHVYELSQIK